MSTVLEAVKAARAERNERVKTPRKKAAASGLFEAVAAAGDPNNAIAIAALPAQPLPKPTAEQIQENGGGVLGYLKAARAIQRAEPSKS
ncbi:MAG TPA: hypothetical protein VGF86_14055 [Candidatus Tumulicola sp.]